MLASNTPSRIGSVTLCAVICAVLQLAIVPNLGSASGYINFSLIFIGYVSTLMSGQPLIFCSFFAGLLYDLSVSGPLGLMSFCLVLSAYVLHLRVQSSPVPSFWSMAGNYLLASLITHLTYFVIQGFIESSKSLAELLAFRMIPAYLLSALCYLPFCLVRMHTVMVEQSLSVDPHHGKSELL